MSAAPRRLTGTSRHLKRRRPTAGDAEALFVTCLCVLAKCCDARIFALPAKYHIEPHDVVRSSVARIKDSFSFHFSELV